MVPQERCWRICLTQLWSNDSLITAIFSINTKYSLILNTKSLELKIWGLNEVKRRTAIHDLSCFKGNRTVDTMVSTVNHLITEMRYASHDKTNGWWENSHHPYCLSLKSVQNEFPQLSCTLIWWLHVSGFGFLKYWSTETVLLNCEGLVKMTHEHY